MARHQSLRRRTPIEWGVRIALALSAAVLGYVSAAHSFAYSLRTRAPERAHALAPWDGRITAAFARKLLGPEAGKPELARSEELSRLALRQDPTAVAAATTLGINLQIRGETAAARRLLAYSDTLSRRDFQTRLWAIEDAVAREDVNSALRHYDIALRTSRTAPDLLFPVLASAVSDPAIRSALVRTLAVKPDWTEGLIYHVSRSAPDPRSVSILFQDLRRASVPVSDEATALLVGSLIADGLFQDAWRYYGSVYPAVSRDMSRDPRFVSAANPPSLFDWMPVNEAGVAASIQRGENGGIFSFATPSGVGGTLLTQMQVLPAGDYVLEGRSSEVDQPVSSRPYWVLSCRDSGEIGRFVMPNSAQFNGAFTGRFRVPAGCPVQYLSLVARASDTVSGVVGQIHLARLRRVR